MKLLSGLITRSNVNVHMSISGNLEPSRWKKNIKKILLINNNK